MMDIDLEISKRFTGGRFIAFPSWIFFSFLSRADIFSDISIISVSSSHNIQCENTSTHIYFQYERVRDKTVFHLKPYRDWMSDPSGIWTVSRF